MEESTASLGISLSDLIALASIWVSPETYGLLGRTGGVWYPNRRRANLGLRVDGQAVEAVGQVIDGTRLDNNTYANVAFKRALGVGRHEFTGFHICHIWPGTAYDTSCYTNIANLVAIPAELSSLTDHHPHIVACLKFRAWELYQWKPAGEVSPVKPEGYPIRWRKPWPINEGARKAALRRASGRVKTERCFASADTTMDASHQNAPGEGPSEDAMIVAFYLSKFDHGALQLGNQGESLDRVSAHLRVKRNTLKNYRDYFDSHTGSHREGWKVPLPPQLARVFAELAPLEEPALRRKVLDILAPLP